MTLETLIELARKILDILLVWGLFYFILKSLRKNVKMIMLFKGILIIVITKILADMLDLVTIGYLIDYVIEWAPLALIIIFQPEIRDALEQLGRAQLLGRHKTLSLSELEKSIGEITSAVDYMRKMRIGALIVIERDIQIKDIIDTGIIINSEISPQVLVNIFTPKTPLHDGAVIISQNKIRAAACMLPLASDQDIAKELGTRHRAAIGISKESDAIVVVVSEETGKMSIAKNGTLIADVREDVLKKILIKNLLTEPNTKNNKKDKNQEDKKAEEKK